MMPARKLASLIAVTAAFAAGCQSGPEVRADSDPGANLASYRTFAFFDDVSKQPSGYTTMLASRLKSATQRELETRGLRMDSNAPQLLVNFHVNVQERTDVQSTPTAGGFYGYRAGLYGMWPGYPQDVHTTHYKQGTLAIDLVDATKRQLVWQGVAEGRINKSAIENPESAIDTVVGEIFKKYPEPSVGSTPAP